MRMPKREDEETMESSLPERLRQLRLDAGLTQQEMGDRLLLSKARISQYENGLRRPSAALLTQYARYFSISVDSILGLTDARQPILPREEALPPIVVEHNGFLTWGIHKGSRIHFSAAKAAAPGDVVLLRRPNGASVLAVLLYLDGKPCYLSDPLAGEALAQREGAVIGVAVSATIRAVEDARNETIDRNEADDR